MQVRARGSDLVWFGCSSAFGLRSAIDGAVRPEEAKADSRALERLAREIRLEGGHRRERARRREGETKTGEKSKGTERGVRKAREC